MNKFNISIYIETSNGSDYCEAEYDCLDESITVTGKRNTGLFSGPNLIVQNLYIIYEDEDTGKEYYGDVEGEFDSFYLSDNDFENQMLYLYEARLAKQANKEITQNINEKIHEQNKFKADLIGQSYTDFKNLDCSIIEAQKNIPAVINAFKGTIELPQGYLKNGEGNLNIQGETIDFKFSSNGFIDSEAHNKILNKFEAQTVDISEKQNNEDNKENTTDFKI